MRATFPSHLTLLDFFILILFVEENKLYEPPHYAVFQPPTISSLCGPNILLTTLFSYTNTFRLCSSELLGVIALDRKLRFW
jgi:hypothetical protein